MLTIALMQPCLQIPARRAIKTSTGSTREQKWTRSSTQQGRWDCRRLKQKMRCLPLYSPIQSSSHKAILTTKQTSLFTTLTARRPRLKYYRAISILRFPETSRESKALHMRSESIKSHHRNSCPTSPDLHWKADWARNQEIHFRLSSKPWLILLSKKSRNPWRVH